MSRASRGILVMGILAASLVAVSWASTRVTTADPGVAAITAAVAAHPTLAQQPEYVGGRSGCRRCHLREYRSWEGTPHAKSIEVLSAEDRAKPECIKCHVTGWGEPTGFEGIEATPELAAVGCEVCHGPGSLYKEKEIMEDRDASIAAGLKIPDESTCLGCHNSESPEFPGEFDFEEAVKAGVHEIKR